MQLSEVELARYQFMAETAARVKGSLWPATGVVEGAAAADIGCAPGAISGGAGPTGRAVRERRGRR